MEEILPPYTSGYLDVGNGHNVYYEAVGNPQGKPVLYIHGGPGAGFHESSKKWFDPKLWNIILFDQRGSGKSTPFSSLEHNTTQDLVRDMNTLLDFLNIEKVTLFGGSWGSTLSLVYAIQNSKRVNAMILRGIFLPSKEDNEYVLGGGIQIYQPEAWERFLSIVPKQFHSNPAGYYFEQMKSKDEKIKEKFTYEWAFYESSLLHLKTNSKAIEKEMKEELSYQSLSPLEAHYLLNMCFLPDNYILKNAPSLSHIPTIIIHGRYDMVCQPINAYRLHNAIKGSELYYVIGGHASSEPQVKRKLLWAVKKMYGRV